MKLIYAICLMTLGLTIKFGVPIAIIYVIYRLAKNLILYHAECQDRYARYRQAEQDLNDLEDEINYMKDHDWSKEP